MNKQRWKLEPRLFKTFRSHRKIFIIFHYPTRYRSSTEATLSCYLKISTRSGTALQPHSQCIGHADLNKMFKWKTSLICYLLIYLFPKTANDNQNIVDWFCYCSLFPVFYFVLDLCIYIANCKILWNTNELKQP